MHHHRPVVDTTAERESARMEALARYDVLGTPPEETLDRITRLTKKLFAVPIAIVSFIDGHRQWYKSSEGMTINEVPRQDTFCKHVIAEGKPVIVPDATQDPRFRQHPAVLNEPHVRFYASIPLKTGDGHSIGALCIIDNAPRDFNAAEVEVMEDLAQMVMGALDLRLCANKDSLTGALSRRAFKDELERATALALRHHHDLSVIAIDIDHFKTVNDTYGHAAGDRALTEVVRACMGELRTTDIIGRLGGEEFAVLLPNTAQMSAMKAAEKLRSAVAYQRIPVKDRVIKLTASFGVASLDYTTRDVETLLERADQALYDAKAAGRNRCMTRARPPAELAQSRRRVLKSGQILFNGRNSTMDCTVRSLSDDGAGIDVSNTAGLPDKFDLVIRSDGFEKLCRIVAQTEKHIEVAFG